MPKQRTPLDYPRYQELRSRGLSQNQIAKELGIPESTLRDNLKHHLQAQALRGTPEVHQGTPKGLPEVDLSPPRPSPAPCPPQVHQEIHRILEGRPDGDGGGPMPCPPEGHQGTPRPASLQGPPEDYLRGPDTDFTARDREDLQAVLTWWRVRQQQLEASDTPERQLERQTYHIERRFIDAVRREADLTGESYAAIVNRAFAQYFAGRPGPPRHT
jgi:hypothetical protein